MYPYRFSTWLITLGACVAAGAVSAGSQSTLAPRALAMGGTGVAVAQPSAATTANPAMMAANHHSWSNDIGLTVPFISARIADESKTFDQVDDIQDVIDQFDGFIDDVNNTNNDSEQNAAALNRIATDLKNRLVKFDRDTIRGNVGVGLAFAAPKETLSVGVFTNASMTASVRGELSGNDRIFLEAVIATSSEDGTLTDLVDVIQAIRVDEDGKIIFDSVGRVQASAVGEFGVSFAHSLTLNDGSTLQLGVSPKYVQLRTLQYTESVSGFENDEFSSDQFQTKKSGFNLDVGAAYAFGDKKQWNAGVMIHNLIPMRLKSAATRPILGERVKTLKLNPMATIGIAHKTDYLITTAEIDLTKKQAFGFEDDTQWLALGAEYDAWRYVQLRTGIRFNLASNNDNEGIAEKTQFTAGVGLNFSGARVDIGALISDAELGAALELSIAF